MADLAQDLNGAVFRQELIATLDGLEHNKLTDKGKKTLQRAASHPKSLTRIHDHSPLLRPEEFDVSIEVNAALQHARKVLYRPNLLGEPKALHIKSTPGFLGVWFHRQTVGWPLSTGDGGAASMAFKKAYVQGESSIVTLDRIADASTGTQLGLDIVPVTLASTLSLEEREYQQLVEITSFVLLNHSTSVLSRYLPKAEKSCLKQQLVSLQKHLEQALGHVCAVFTTYSTANLLASITPTTDISISPSFARPSATKSTTQLGNANTPSNTRQILSNKRSLPTSDDEHPHGEEESTDEDGIPRPPQRRKTLHLRGLQEDLRGADDLSEHQVLRHPPNATPRRSRIDAMSTPTAPRGRRHGDIHGRGEASQYPSLSTLLAANRQSVDAPGTARGRRRRLLPANPKPKRDPRHQMMPHLDKMVMTPTERDRIIVRCKIEERMTWMQIVGVLRRTYNKFYRVNQAERYYKGTRDTFLGWKDLYYYNPLIKAGLVVNRDVFEPDNISLDATPRLAAEFIRWSKISDREVQPEDVIEDDDDDDGEDEDEDEEEQDMEVEVIRDGMSEDDVMDYDDI